MTDDKVEKAVDSAAATVIDATEATADVVKKAAKKTEKAVEDSVTVDVDTAATADAVEQLSEDVEDLAADTADATGDAVAQGKQYAKEVTTKTKKTAKGAADAITADLEAIDAQVKQAAGRARETIDDAVESGTATSADIRKALDDLVIAIENQRVFVDARKAFESAFSSIEKSQTISFVRQTTEEATQEVRRRPLRDMIQKVLFAGIGAAALTRDEVEAFVNRMVQRGDIAADEAEAVVEDVMVSSKKQAARLDAEVDKRVQQALKQGDVPTVEDIEDLNAKIAALQRKVEELSKKAS